MPPIDEHETSGIRRFETVGPPARRVHEGNGPLAPLLLLATTATIGVAVWLFAVIVAILPARDPAQIPMWRGVALAFLGYSGLSLAFLYTHRRVPLLRGIFLLASATAVGAGLYGIVSMASTAGRGGHFEGYVVLMGWILCCHGVTGILFARKPAKAALRAGSN